MANNRMYLQCTVCKEAILIAKYYPRTNWEVWRRGSFTISDPQDLTLLRLKELAEQGVQPWEYRITEINKFFDDHHHSEQIKTIKTGGTNFKLMFEAGEGDYNIKGGKDQ